jgi:hypothetical protein
MALWRQRKMSYEVTQTELISTRDHAAHHIEELDKHRRLEVRVVQDMAAAAVLRDSTWQRPWKPADVVEQAWLRQFACAGSSQERRSPLGGCNAGARSASDHSDTLRRFKVLVYDGPSRTGKSERARHWFGAETTLVVQCQGVDSPNLLQWVDGKHICILYEEANWKLLWYNRMLMQSGPLPVHLGQSPTNQYAYTVNVFRVPMILVSNDFWSGCSDREAREWIAQNTCYR